MTVAERLTFVLDGRDDLSRVLGHAGDSATRLRNTMTDASDGSNRAILTLTRDADGRLRDLQGQFVSTADAARLMATRTGGMRRPMADWSQVADRGRAVGERLKAMLISLAPAAIPAAAAMAPLVASTAAAGVAVGVYGAALGPQIAAMGEAAEAEKKYTDAVEKSGKGSKEAVAAQVEYQRAMAKLPPATRTAAAALSVFKDTYKSWSDSVSDDTMAPLTKGLGIATALLPKLTPMVRGTSVELDRMMTLVGGGMESPGFDRLIGKFSGFANNTLRSVNDRIIDFLRRLDTGKVGGNFAEFMDFARQQGPVVGETLRNIARALTNVLIAGADVGVGMLTVVNALSEVIAAVPPGAITAVLQLAIALKLVRLAAAGWGVVHAALVAVTAQLIGMRAAAAAAPGRLAAVTAAIGAMSRGARLAVAGTGIGLLLIALAELSQAGGPVRADMDRMTTSIGNFARSGKLSGEAAKVLGKDFKEFDESLRGMARPDQLNQMQQSFTRFFLQDSTPVKRWKGVLDDIDKSLANLVQSGNADLAAQAFDRFAARARSQGLTTGELKKQLGDYKAALANLKFEQELAAQSLGLFGAQSQATKTKLDAQKASADGLRQAIQALNDVHRAGLGGLIGFEAAIDAGTKAAKENAGSLKMVNGVLQLGSEKSRTAASALNDLASKTDEAAGSARENGASWRTVNGIYDKGRRALIANAMQMGLTREQAARLASQILKTPDKTARLRGNMEDLQAKLNNAKAQLKRVPDSRKAAVRAQIAQLESELRRARGLLSGIDGTSATTYVKTEYSYYTKGPGPHASGYVFAKGGLVGFPSGGHVRGPGTGTSDSIIARVSNGEYVIPAKRVAQMGVGFFDSIRDGKLGTALPVRSAAAPARVAAMAAPRTSPTVVQHIQVTVPGLVVDPTGTAQAIDNVLTKHKRNRGGGKLNFEK